MFAITSIAIEPSGEYKVFKGLLFSLPVELIDNYRISQYVGENQEGWSISEFGYLRFQKTEKTGKRFVFPGLYLTDGPRPRKKFYGYKPKLSKEDVEMYVDTHMEREKNLRNQADQEMTALVHDLRHLSGAIYHSAEQASQAFKENNKSEIYEGIKTIVATQTMLKARINYLDYVSGIDRFELSEHIPIYSRIDKVIRCFSAATNKERVKIDLSGKSFRFASGPNILDIVPYTLIDNAIKYSPPNFLIEVSVNDTDDNTIAIVSSVGPKILEAEKDNIFKQGVRGEKASKIRPSGTGLGLAVAKDIIDQFNGSIKVEILDEVCTVDGVPHHKTNFSFSIPSSGEDSKRKDRYSFGKKRRTSKRIKR